MKIDNVDMEIVKILSENGRIPNNEIASRLTISEGTVRNRIKKLTEGNFLKVKGMINPDEGTEKQLIYILITLQVTKKWKETAEKIAKLRDVKSVSMITGRFDLLVELFIEPQNLMNFLTDELSTIGEVFSTESLVTIKNFNKWV
jgi:Lrp/AsnC family transcriptional regulator for asnA, asnC and gidA